MKWHLFQRCPLPSNEKSELDANIHRSSNRSSDSNITTLSNTKNPKQQQHHQSGHRHCPETVHCNHICFENTNLLNCLSSKSLNKGSVHARAALAPLSATQKTRNSSNSTIFAMPTASLSSIPKSKTAAT